MHISEFDMDSAVGENQPSPNVIFMPWTLGGQGHWPVNGSGLSAANGPTGVYTIFKYVTRTFHLTVVHWCPSARRHICSSGPSFSGCGISLFYNHCIRGCECFQHGSRYGIEMITQKKYFCYVENKKGMMLHDS